MNDLRRGWAWTSLGEIVEPRVDSGGPRSNEITYLDITSIDAGKKRVSEPKHIAKSEAPSRARQNVQCGDVLVSLTRPNLNAVAMVRSEYDGAVASTAFHVLRAVEVEPAWLYYLVQTHQFINAMCARVQGALYPAIRPADVMQYRVPLAPLPEQRRIVAEIEKQLTRLDASELSLHQGQGKLAVCRRAVLQAAIQGRLNNGIEVQEWPYVPLGDLAEASAHSVTDGPFGSNLKTEHYTEVGPRVIRLQNIGDGKFIEQRSCISPAHFERLKKHAVEPGDLLIAALGSELPRACLAPDSLGPAIVKADCIRFRPDVAQVSAHYLCYALNSHTVRRATRKLVHGVGRPRLNLSEIKSIRIPLAPIKDQIEIVEAVEDKFSLIDAVEAALRTSLQKATGLRQAILKKAFEGKLVRQDPNDEPAAVLLDRIRAARAQAPAHRAPRKREVHP